MKRAWLALATLVLAGLVGPAQAQDNSGIIFGVGPGKILSQTRIPARVRGDLVVTFHGAAARGCAALGLCSYAGTVVVRPRHAELTVLTTRSHGRIGHTVLLDFGFPETAYITSSRVTRSSPGGPVGTCADAQQSLFSGGQTNSTSRGRRVTIRLLRRGGSLLQTRCAGPLDGDLAGVSPTVTVPAARLLRGRVVLDLSGRRTFVAHGFAGTIDSTLVFGLGKARSESSSSSSSPSFPPDIKTRRTRIVTERLSVVRAAGRLGAAVRGTADPVVCTVLDSCGLSGTLSLGPVGNDGVAEVVAMGPASRPYRDFLTAVGVVRGGRSSGISVSVLVNLVGEVHAAMSQAGAACADTGGPGLVAAAIGPASASASASGTFLGSWRTRCPGPTLGDAPGGLSPSLAAGALRHRQFTIRLQAHGSLTDDGYVIAPQGRLAVVLRRGRISQQVITEPVP